MAASFAAYASQYLNRPPTTADSQPLFYSFSTDGDPEHMGHSSGNRPRRRNSDMELEDADDPHLVASGATSKGGGGARHDIEDGGYPEYPDMDDMEDEDPYLRLDEEERNVGISSMRYNTQQAQSAPLLTDSRDTQHSKGWLAHHGGGARSPSPSPSLSDSDSDDGGMPAGSIYSSRRDRGPSRGPPSYPHSPRSANTLPPPQTAIAMSLTESLLPRDGRSRPTDVFSLPDPRHTSRGRRRHNDSHWTAAWLTGLGLCFLFSIITLFIVRTPKKPSKDPVQKLPYITLIHTVPLLTILTVLAGLAAYLHLFLLKIFAKPVMIGTSLFVPVTLFVSAVWAFVGSFMWDGDTVPTWGESTGLRLFSIVPLILSILTARRLLDLPQDIHTTSSLLDLTAHVLMQNPYLLALSPAILLAALVLSIPFITLTFRLLLIGKWHEVPGGGISWHVYAWADWIIALVLTVWLWSWGVARGILRVAAAGVVGSWYFADQNLPPPPPGSTHTLHAAVTRATETSLGSVALSALILTGLRLLSISARFCAWLPLAAPLAARPYIGPVSTGMIWGIQWIEQAVHARTMSSHALVYVGLTGTRFMPAARRAGELANKIEKVSAGRYRRKFRTEPSLTLLTITPLTLTLPFALGTYLFVAHTLGAPDAALGAAVLAGATTALVGLFCVGLVKDTSDTLYLCYCIDKDSGMCRRRDVFAALEHEPPAPPQPVGPAPTGPLSGLADALDDDMDTLPPPVTQPGATRAAQALVSPANANTPLPEYPEYSPTSSRSASPAPVRGPARVGQSAVSDITSPSASANVQRGPAYGASSMASDEDGEESQLFPGSDLF